MCSLVTGFCPSGYQTQQVANRRQGDIHMKQFKPSLLTLALATTGLVSGYSYAAEEGADTEVEEVIKVTGIRGSLMRAQAVKMDSTNVVEAISAEDIGKLPDSSIAESLARLPGLAGERRDGRTSGLSVRGFAEDYVGTTLNGREVLGMGDNRGVEYDLYPSEIMSGVTVYKTMDSTLTTQGIGGTVNMQTVRPLASDEFAAINFNLEQNGMKSANPDFDDSGHRVAASFSKKFANDTIGVAVAVATMESPSQEEHLRVWGDGNYAGVSSPTFANGTSMPAEGGLLVHGGHDSYVRSGILERDTVSAVVQFAPTDDLKVTVDALMIDFTDTQIKRGLEEGGPEWGVGAAYTVTEIEKGLVTKGSITPYRSIIRNDAYEKKAELKAFAANIEYQLNDNWKAELDISTSTSDKTITDVESYSGVGRAGHKDQGAGVSRDFEMTSKGIMFSNASGPDYSDPTVVMLAGPQAWGSDLKPYSSQIGTNSSVVAAGADPLDYNHAQDGFVNKPIFDEELTTIRFDTKGIVELGPITQVTLGAQYTDRTKSKDNTGAFLTVKTPTWPGYARVPEEFIVGTASMEFMGIGKLLAYDSLALYQSGAYKEWDAAYAESGRLGDSYVVDEQVLQAYVKLDLEAELGSVFMKGNFGVQYVSSEQSSTGYFASKKSDASILAKPTVGGDEYSHVLPSLTLNFEFSDDHVVRTAVAKTISRARIDDLRASGSISFDGTSGRISSTNVENSPWSSNGGNPMLRPLEANQFDLSYDWYFAEDGFVSAAFYYKDLVNWHRQASLLTNYLSGYIPEVHNYLGEAPKIYDGFNSAKEDGREGYVRGYEVQVNFPFNMLSDGLDGLGILASAAFTDGGLDDGGRIKGLSEESFQLTMYYEVNGLEFRISGRKRDEFLTETRGKSLALTETEDLGSTLWDAQIGFDFGKAGFESLDGLSISLQAQNLTDEDSTLANASDNRLVEKYQSFGANYLLGVNYKF